MIILRCPLELENWSVSDIYIPAETALTIEINEPNFLITEGNCNYEWTKQLFLTVE